MVELHRWLVAGGRAEPRAIAVSADGGTLIYVGGMFLNDAFDVEFDRQHRKERPIPAGLVKVTSVWRAGSLMLAVGVGLLFGAGMTAGIAGLLLAGFVIAYDALHKKISFAPVLMGACRFCLYLAAGLSVSGRLNVGVAAGAGGMLLYIVGLSYIARKESAAGPDRAPTIRWWALALLVAPIASAVARNHASALEPVLLVSAVRGFGLANACVIR